MPFAPLLWATHRRQMRWRGCTDHQAVLKAAAAAALHGQRTCLFLADGVDVDASMDVSKPSMGQAVGEREKWVPRWREAMSMHSTV